MGTRLVHPQPGEISELVRDRLRKLLLHLDELNSFVPAPGSWQPAVDLCEMSDAILLRVELPGLGPEDVRLTIRDNSLRIDGRKMKRKANQDTPQPSTGSLRYLCLERTWGSFSRTFALECPVLVDEVEAKLANGILEVRLPKSPACGRDVRIPIKESSS